MSLANKHRPINFSTTIWQEHISEILKAQIQKDQNIKQNFLFFGPRWTGKTSTARILAKAINCTNIQDWNPCNECENCKTIQQTNTLDYIEIDAASHTGVDNIREEIIDKVSYPPTVLKKKIYVIDEVHMLSNGAFNALLKTIEEPKDNVNFILATTEINKIPETIISRCQVFNFKKINIKAMTDHLEAICLKEDITHDKNALSMISKISDWCMRDAIKYVDQISILWNINEENVSKFLGISSDKTIQDFLNIIIQWNQKEIFNFIDNIDEQWNDLEQFAKQTLLYINQNLNENTNSYLEIANYLWKIISNVKFFPNINIIYKMILKNYLDIKNNIKEPNIDKKTNNNNTTQKTEQKEQLKEKNDLNNKQWNTNKNIIWEIKEKTNNILLKNNIENQCEIKKEDNKLTIYTINKILEMSLKKDENIRELENIVNNFFNTNITIHIQYKTKEDFLNNMSI